MVKPTKFWFFKTLTNSSRSTESSYKRIGNQKRNEEERGEEEIINKYWLKGSKFKLTN